ncbi:MAG: endopeptidase La [Clostridia bacterium]|nr:endopeptidase La [Clostridia bacterium]
MSLTEIAAELLILNTVCMRGIVIFPGVSATFEIGRKASVCAVREAVNEDGLLFLLCQKDASEIEPKAKDLHTVGTVVRVTHFSKLSNGNYQVMVDGLSRGIAERVVLDGGRYVSTVTVYNSDNPQSHEEDERDAIHDVMAAFSSYVKYIAKPVPDVLERIKIMDSADELADFLANEFLVKSEDRQEALNALDPVSRLGVIAEIFARETQLLDTENEIQQKVRVRLQKAQKDMYLREQLNVIKQELGMGYDDDDDGDEYYEKITSADLPDEVRQKLYEENTKLGKMPFGTAEGTVIRNYIETVLELPWNSLSKDRSDIRMAEKILNEDHDGLDKVKERILEYMAVRQLSPQLNGQILCLVGPPGVGKTSIGKSIARATNRKYVRISLGGVRDEAEIRGHRKTYIGSMPGRIMNGMKLAGTRNPVMLLDEVDKLTRDAHGDPTSALLEVLDSEQNRSFRDHFIELPFDLSECMFITTANTVETIPQPLLDRMEVIFMDSYSFEEKMSIAKNHLIRKQLKRHGLSGRTVRFTDGGIAMIIQRYTKESGVRNLDREIASVCRKIAKLMVSEGIKSYRVDEKSVIALLGPEKYLPDLIYDKDEVGVVNGLAWTSLGGEMLRVECVTMAGTGRLELTGHLGDVMKESAKAAVSYIRKHSDTLGVSKDFHKELDIHIHVPEGAIPKDGPSAGVTITTALVSELTGKSVKQSVAMTGEITLTGRVLPIGGLKEKCMAAKKAGITKVIIPKDNLKDTVNFAPELKEGLEFVPVSEVGEVLKTALNER